MVHDPDASIVLTPARYIPPVALAFGAGDGDATFIDADHPLPVSQRLTPAGNTPLTGTASATGVVGPFSPVLGRPIWLSLSGTWTGTVTLKRSIDGGATMLPLTVASQPWGVFTANACEPVTEESESMATYHLDIVLASGTLAYRVAQ